MRVDFSKRSEEKELMDDLTLSNEALRQNLDELEWINRLLGGNAVVLSALDFLYKKGLLLPHTSIADFGCGGGDLLRSIAVWGRKKKLPLHLVGYDANPFMIDYASQKAKEFPEISFIKQDIFEESFLEKGFSVVLCSLFCHHFTDRELVSFLQKIKPHIQTALIINDLHRHWFAYYSIKWLTVMLRGSYLVQNDAPLSVLRAFSAKELHEVMQKVGFDSYFLRWKWAFRYQVIGIH